MVVRISPVFMLAVVLTVTGRVTAGPPPLLELTSDGTAHRGRLVAFDDDLCWLMYRDGMLRRLPLDSVGQFGRTGETFRPCTSAELRGRLRREFGPGLEVAASEHYLVCAPPGRAERYARLFEEVYREFRLYFGVRGFQVAKPEFPLVAIVFPDHAAFARYCRQDEVEAVRGLMGYYMPTTNRVAVYESDEEQSAAGRLAETIVHEATHQIAFNTGLHSRIAENPAWVVEGLAMLFEAHAGGGPHRRSRRTPVHRERLAWFAEFARERRPRRSLAGFVAGNDLFRSAPLDAYSQAWALTWYLVETRPADYARYLKRIAARDPLAPYGETERLADFQAVFGRDLDRLETDFLRAIEELSAGRGA